jgi:NAD(P)H-hydrate epimerase
MIDKSTIPYLSLENMIQVDRLMVDQLGIHLSQMMENVGRSLAELARSRFLAGDPGEKRICILAGSGGNGGGAMVCARHLSNGGAAVQLYLTKPEDQLTGVNRIQVEILQKIGTIQATADLPPISYQPDLIVDGIIGYNLNGAAMGRAAQLINWANAQLTPILALDLPSGLHANTGEVFTPVIKATATMTLALPKLGLKNPAQPVVGELYLADIGVPPGLYANPSINLQVGSIFSEKSIIRL